MSQSEEDSEEKSPEKSEPEVDPTKNLFTGNLSEFNLNIVLEEEALSDISDSQFFLIPKSENSMKSKNSKSNQKTETESYKTEYS